MKKAIYIVLLLFVFTIKSCVFGISEHNMLVKGQTKDIFRNIVSPGVKIIMYGDHKKLDSTISDVNGNYQLEYTSDDYLHYHVKYFNSFKNKLPYNFELHSDNYPDLFPTTQNCNYMGYIELEYDKENEIDVNAFVPVVWKVNTQVENNIHHKLRSKSSCGYGSPKYYHHDYNRVIIKSENIDTLYYFTARPNTEMRLYFIYNPTPEDIHSNPEQVVYPIQTTTIDTISLSYSIDCNSF